MKELLQSKLEKLFQKSQKPKAFTGNYFKSILEGLDLKRPEIFEANNPAEDAIKTFENYPSIKKIKFNISQEQCSLSFMDTDDFKKKIRKLDVSKASQMLGIPIEGVIT